MPLEEEESEHQEMEKEEMQNKDEVLGLQDFKEAVEFQNVGNYQMAEQSLKEGLKKLKQSGQEKSLGYLFLLKRLGYVSF